MLQMVDDLQIEVKRALDANAARRLKAAETFRADVHRAHG